MKAQGAQLRVENGFGQRARLAGDGDCVESRSGGGETFHGKDWGDAVLPVFTKERGPQAEIVMNRGEAQGPRAREGRVAQRPCAKPEHRVGSAQAGQHGGALHTVEALG